MPTIFTHPASVLALAPWWRRIPRGLAVIAAVCTALPDADVVAFGLGIPYAPLGHRGFSHSIVFALVIGAFVAFAYRQLAGSDVSFANGIHGKRDTRAYL